MCCDDQLYQLYRPTTVSTILPWKHPTSQQVLIAIFCSSCLINMLIVESRLDISMAPAI